MPPEQTPTSVNQETIGGLERPLLYDAESDARILQLHASLQNEFHLQNSYIKFVNTGAEMIGAIQIDDKTTMYIGPIGAFKAEQIARMIHEQTINYVIQGTMGKNFPKDSPGASRELLATMSDGFSSDRIIVLVEHADDDKVTPVAGVQASFNESDTPLKHVLYKPSKDITPSLSTFQAINLPMMTPRLKEFIEEYGDMPESRAVCMSRLFRQDKNTASKLSWNQPEVAWELMASLAIGIAVHADRNSDRLTMPSIVLYDTHADSIQKKLEQYFGMKLLSAPGQTEATPNVLSTILQHHYDTEENGGFQRSIITGFAPLDTYTEHAFKFLQSRGRILDPAVHVSLARTEDTPPQPSARDLSPEILIFQYDMSDHRTEMERPGDRAPEVIDHHTAAGIDRLKEISRTIPSPEKNILLAPFQSGLKELSELYAQMSLVPNEKTDIVALLVKRILTRSPQLEGQSLHQVFEQNMLASDVSIFLSRLSACANTPKTIEDDSRWIWFPTEQKLMKYIGHDAHNVLSTSRMLGLIPLSTIDKIRSTRIHIAGASAVAQTIDLLVACGAEHVTWVDGGFIDPSNLPRFPGGMSSIARLGQSKAQALQDTSYLRNPYGRFVGLHGHIVPTDADKTSKMDMTFAQFADSDLGFEVIDQPYIKMQLRAYLRENHPKFPLVFLADTSNPIASVEYGEAYNPFSHHIPADEIARMTNPPTSLDDMLRSVTLMLGEEFPEEHRIQFTYFLLGLLPFWSQTPIAAHQSASIANTLILASSDANPLAGETFTSSTLPTEIVPHLNPEEAELFKTMFQTLLRLPERY